MSEEAPTKSTDPGSPVPGGQAPGVPADEAGRLAELHSMGVLDSGSDPDLDALVDMAALVAGSPMALITLLDADEQVFKASYGLDAAGTPREVSFCGHAIAAGHAPMVVTDSREDPRFADNPLVTGEPHVIFYAGIPLVTGAGHAIGTLCVLDSTPRELEPRQLEALARLASQATGLIELARRNRGAVALPDPRTGLPLSGTLVTEMESDGGTAGPASVIALRVDDVGVDGSAGGLLVDGALRAVSDIIVECLPAGARLARAFGSFVAVLPHVDAASARAVVVAIREGLQRPVDIGGDRLVQVALTAGVASLPRDGVGAVGTLVTAAEEALGQAEAFGNSFVVVQGDETAAAHARARTIRADLVGALDAGQLVVHYQPVVRLAGAEWVGSEALVRWQHPDLGLVMPDEFIPFAEDLGVIAAIDQHVLRVALHDLAAGRAPGHEVSVNVSPAGLVDGLPDIVAAELWDSGVRPAALLLEVTERLRLDREPRALEVLREVAELGVRIAVDDFGAGTTSLTHLRNMPAARLKLDRALVADLDGPDARRAALVVRALSQLAVDLGVEVLGEGVETPVQAEMLIAEGVLLGQGYLFGRPTAPQAV